MERGIDVSENNGHVDWAAVAGAGFTYAYARATLGRESNDPTFAANRDGAKAHGLRFGAYHLPYPSNSSAQQQAQHFLSVAKPQPGDLLPSLDVELKSPPDTGEAALTTSQLVAWLRAWLAAVEHAIGAKPLVYTNPGWWASRLEAADLTDHPLWLANYTGGTPSIPPPWRAYAIWQHSETGTVGGQSPFDLNRCPDLGAVTIGAADPVLALGSSGAAVVRMKGLLTAWSQAHPPAFLLKPNNVLGQAAVAAVVRFQRASGLAPTGKVEARTWAALERAVPPLPSGPIAGTHFSADEVLATGGFVALPARVLAAATRHARNMEKLRAELNRRRAAHGLDPTGLSVASWARTPDQNTKLSGVAGSRHVVGDACDVARAEILRVCPWPGGASDFDQAADAIFANGGIGIFPGGKRHLDSRGSRARWRGQDG